MEFNLITDQYTIIMKYGSILMDLIILIDIFIKQNTQEFLTCTLDTLAATDMDQLFYSCVLEPGGNY